MWRRDRSVRFTDQRCHQVMRGDSMQTKMPSVIIAMADARKIRAMRLLLREVGIPIKEPLRRRECWVATANGHVIGCSRIEIVGEYALLRNVAVEKVWRHKGVGSRLVKKCLLEIRAADRTMIALVTMFWNVNFFRRFGFRTVSRQDLHTQLRKMDVFSHPTYRFTTPMLLDVNRKNRPRIAGNSSARGHRYVLVHG